MNTITAVLCIFSAIVLILGWRTINKKEGAPTRGRYGGRGDNAAK